MEKGKDQDFTKDNQGMLWFNEHICVWAQKELKQLILKEAHEFKYSIHLGSAKIYHDLRN